MSNIIITILLFSLELQHFKTAISHWLHCQTHISIIIIEKRKANHINGINDLKVGNLQIQ